MTAAQLLKSWRGWRVLHAPRMTIFAPAEQPQWVASLSAETALCIEDPSVTSFAFFLLPPRSRTKDQRV